MDNRIEDAFKELIFTLQMAKLYGSDHVKFDASVDKAYAQLENTLDNRNELIIGIVGEELAFEKEIFFELSNAIKPIIIYLKARGIEKITFFSGLQREELKKFIVFLAGPKEAVIREPQEYMDSLGVKNIRVGKIGFSKDPQSKKPDLSVETAKAIEQLSLYDNSLKDSTQAIADVLGDKEVDYDKLKNSLGNVTDGLLLHYSDLLKLATVKRYDINTFVHSLNVCILSMYFSYKLGFCKEDVLQIGIASIFHDIGKLYISRNILTKPSRLTDEEFVKIKSHAPLGAEILLKYTDKLGLLPVVIAFEHHLRYNMSGYPKLDIPYRQHEASMIVSICDVYDALSQRRSYKNDYPPNMIYDIMINDRGSVFEPALLDRFFKAMGVWPIGTIVRLSDNRVAIVREENENEIFLPKVEVLDLEGADRLLLDLSTVRDSVKIGRYLNPLNEGKDYLKFV